MDASFDPSAAARPRSGLFGLPPLDPDRAAVHVIPVPVDATASYRKGAAHGPAAVLRASHQVELFDLEHGRPYEAGIHLLADDGGVAELDREATARADDRERVDALLERVNAVVRERAEAVLAAGKLPVVLGGDHSAPFGAIEACARRFPGLGVLHFDAHADLRPAYEGYTWSHASILHNVVERLDGVARVVQVGVRDLCEEEREAIRASSGRIHTLFDRGWARAKLDGEDLRALVAETLAELPRDVYLTFDVDGLDPTLCPNTGTPVPGGLDWHECGLWLTELARSGRRIVGLDLVEVSPGPVLEAADAWDAIVGARLLYRLIGAALMTRS